jgi:hypothetical protein
MIDHFLNIIDPPVLFVNKKTFKIVLRNELSALDTHSTCVAIVKCGRRRCPWHLRCDCEMRPAQMPVALALRLWNMPVALAFRLWNAAGADARGTCVATLKCGRRRCPWHLRCDCEMRPAQMPVALTLRLWNAAGAETSFPLGCLGYLSGSMYLPTIFL